MIDKYCKFDALSTTSFRFLMHALMTTKAKDDNDNDNGKIIVGSEANYNVPVWIASQYITAVAYLYGLRLVKRAFG